MRDNLNVCEWCLDWELGGGGLTAIDKLDDLLVRHTSAFGGSERGFLLQAPGVDVVGVCGVAGAG